MIMNFFEEGHFFYSRSKFTKKHNFLVFEIFLNDL